MKTPKSDPDASVDRLLAGALKARAESTPGDCLDAETLAAWADDTLEARERASAEAHAADCARCQALLAAMVRTMPATVAATSPWRMPALGWLVPLTAAAAALVVWVVVPGRAPVQKSESAAATVDQLAPAKEVRPQSQVAIGQEALRERTEAAPLEKRARAGAPPVSANALSDTKKVDVAPPPAIEAPLAAPRSAAESAARRDAAAPPARMLSVAPPSAPDRVIVSSNPATRFRLLPGGGVQRTADGGSTWRTEVTGATETLVAGDSPSPSVCWLVGPAGAVFLSTDGRSWRRLAFPEATDLQSVTATDNETATVTAADGRAFITTDGGQTWSRAP